MPYKTDKPAIKCYQGKELLVCWSKAAPMIAEGVKHTRGQLTVEIIETMLKEGRAQLWFGEGPEWGVAVVTVVAVYPFGRAVSILLGGGHGMRHWLDLMEGTLMKFGAANNCNTLEACVRPGFVGAVYRPERAILKGCEIVSTVIRKPIPSNFVPDRTEP